jgi:predicted Rossmann fold nucleotide-binding protein DprA/Smf involved in DNA uptake
MTMEKEFKALQKDIKDIQKKIDNFIKALETEPKAKAPKAKAKKAPAKKKATKVTATDQVLKIINRSKKGVNTATLMEKTGFNQKKVTNILHRTFKAGKIKRAAKGIYVGAQ